MACYDKMEATKNTECELWADLFPSLMGTQSRHFYLLVSKFDLHNHHLINRLSPHLHFFYRRLQNGWVFFFGALALRGAPGAGKRLQAASRLAAGLLLAMLPIYINQPTFFLPFQQ